MEDGRCKMEDVGYGIKEKQLMDSLHALQFPFYFINN